MKTDLENALAIVRAAGYRCTRPKPCKPKSERGPTFVAVFADGECTRMTVHSPCALDWERGHRLAVAAWQTRERQREVAASMCVLSTVCEGKPNEYGEGWIVPPEAQFERVFQEFCSELSLRTAPPIESCWFERDGEVISETRRLNVGIPLGWAAPHNWGEVPL